MVPPGVAIWWYESKKYIDKFIKISEELTDFYKEIEVCIEKVKIKYHDVDVILYQDNHTGGLNNPLHGTRFVWVKFRKNI